MKNKKINKSSTSSISVVAVIILFVIMIALGLTVGALINPMYLIGVFAIFLGYPFTIKVVKYMNKYSKSKSTPIVYVPFFNEFTIFTHKGTEVFCNALMIIITIVIGLLLLGTVIPQASIPNLLATLSYKSTGVMDNVKLLLYYRIMVYCILFLYLAVDLVRGYEYCRLDTYIYNEEKRLFALGENKYSRNKTSDGRSAIETLNYIMFFIPIVRVLFIWQIYRRLFKLVQLYNLSRQTASLNRTSIVTEEGDLDE